MCALPPGGSELQQENIYKDISQSISLEQQGIYQSDFQGSEK